MILGRKYKPSRFSEATMKWTIHKQSLAKKISVDIADDKLYIQLAWQYIAAFSKQSKKKCLSPSRNGSHNVSEQILNNISGSACSSRTLAILGNHNAGKSVLLKVLSGQHLHNIEVSGYRVLNGLPIKEDYKKLFAYFPPGSLLYGNLTVYEHVMYEALLQLDSISIEKKKEKVLQVINLLNLKHCISRIIGVPGILKGISTGDRKKLSFASKLLIDAQILLCDDPTFGVDQSGAVEVLNVLHNLASAKSIVICALDQPTSDAYALFHDVMILSQGRVVFMGPKTDALKFFSSIRHPCLPYHNPSDHFLRFLLDRETKRIQGVSNISDVCEKYSESEYIQQYMEHCYSICDNHIEPLPSTEQLPQSKGSQHLSYRSCCEWLKQFVLFFERSHLCTYREPLLTTIQLAVAVGMSSMLTILFHNHKANFAHVYGRNNLLFLFVTIPSSSIMLPVTMTFHRNLKVFSCEKQQYYRTSAYLAATIVAEILAFFLIPFFFMSGTYYLVDLNFEPVAFILCTVIVLLCIFVTHAFGHFIASCFMSMKKACIITSLTNFILMIFGGNMVNLETIYPYFSWPKYLSWYWYSYELLMVNQWSTIRLIECQPDDKVFCFVNGTEVLVAYGFSAKNFILDFCILVSMVLLFHILTYVMLIVNKCRPPSVLK